MSSARNGAKGAPGYSKWRPEVIGLGKAGLPLAAVIADSGIKVTGVDINKNTVLMINNGKNPIPEEPGLSGLIHEHIGENLIATSDAESAARQSNVHIVIVPLFIDHKKNPDFRAIVSALTSIGKGLKKNDLVVLETTVPVGTTNGLVKETLEKTSRLRAGRDFFLAFSPERIMTGYSISRFREFPKIVGGIDDKSTEKAYEFYKIFAKIRKVKDAKTAELTKIAEGIYRDVNIALANELWQSAEKYGVDYWLVKAAASHQYCSLLEPGLVGGHCIPVYPWFIINENALPLIETARNVNDSMIRLFASRAIAIAKPKKPAKIAILGLSYREGVKEHAYAQSIPLIALLKKEGHQVFGFDPLYTGEETEKIFGAKPLASADEAKNMDAVILVNKLTQYRQMLQKIREKVVDIKNVLA